MKNIIKIAFLAIIAIVLVSASGCASSKKRSCGCSGMIGY
jgi:hypothetical protein